MWCLCRLLPLMIAENIPDTDLRWQNFLRLLEIIDITFAPVLSNDQVAYLRFLIEEHHQTFIELYPSCSITPKFHYMVHYPQWISRCVVALIHCALRYFICVFRCGPLSRFWCMRFESKHNYFKDLAHRVRCFKNIPKTLANHHQRLTCLYQQTTGNVLDKNTLTGPGKRDVMAMLTNFSPILMQVVVQILPV